MRKIKSILSIFLVLAMCIGTCNVALAATDGMKIVLRGSDNAVIDGTFSVLNNAGTTMRFNYVSPGRYQVNAAGTVTTLATSGGECIIKNTDIGSYTFVQRTTSGGYIVAPSQAASITAADQDNVVTVNIMNQSTAPPVAKGKVRITSVDNVGARVQGAEFGLYKNNVLIAELTCNTSGMAISDNLEAGDYEIKLQSAPSTHELTEQAQTFSIVNDGDLKDVEFTLQQKAQVGNLQISVGTTAGEAVIGSIYGLYSTSGSKINEITTDSTGLAKITDLPVGQYYLQQIAPGNGGVSIDKTNVTITNNGNAFYSIVVNKAVTQGTIEVIVTDQESFIPLQGVLLSVYSSVNDAKVTEMTTNYAGIASIAIDAGHYYVKAESVPESYSTPDSKMAFVVSIEQKTDLKMQLTKATGKLRINVVDEQKKAVNGATFSIFDYQTDIKARDIVVDNDGFASVNLPYGRYYIKQTSTSDQFVNLSGQTSFTIDATEVSLEIVNPRKNGKLKIVVTDDSGLKLDGVKYWVLQKTDESKVIEIATTSEGIAEVELPVGDYLLTMSTAKTGYSLSGEKVSFTVKTNDITELSLKNTKLVGKIRVTVQDTEDSPLENVTLAIQNKDGDVIGQLVSNASGLATSEFIPYGDYSLVQVKIPSTHKLDRNYKKDVTLSTTNIMDIAVTIEGIKGTLILRYKDVATGAELNPEYSYTDYIGKDYMSWVRSNNYDRKPITGYTFVRVEYPESSVLTADSLVITYFYTNAKTSTTTGSVSSNSGTMVGIDNESGLTVTSGISTTVPKTGELPPYSLYALACAAFVIAAGLLLATKKRLPNTTM